jgi:hypothetical protein
VLVTSVGGPADGGVPLPAYLFREGLARFASV